MTAKRLYSDAHSVFTKPFAGGGGGSFFPPSQKCRWMDGTTTDLVPSFVNPLMFTLLVPGAVLLGIALGAVFRPEKKMVAQATPLRVP